MNSQTLTDDTFSAQDENGNDMFMLITNSQDIRSTLADISRFDLSEDAGLLYVRNGDAEILEVWYSERSNPDLGATVYQAYPFDPVEVGQDTITVNCPSCNSLNNATWTHCYNCLVALPETEEQNTMNLTHYHVIENTPDYLPDSMDNPAIFENISDATVYAHDLVNELIDQCYECSGDSVNGYYCELDAYDLGRNIKIIECTDQGCVDWLNEQ